MRAWLSRLPGVGCALVMALFALATACAPRARSADDESRHVDALAAVPDGAEVVLRLDSAGIGEEAFRQTLAGMTGADVLFSDAQAERHKCGFAVGRNLTELVMVRLDADSGWLLAAHSRRSARENLDCMEKALRGAHRSTVRARLAVQLDGARVAASSGDLLLIGPDPLVSSAAERLENDAAAPPRIAAALGHPDAPLLGLWIDSPMSDVRSMELELYAHGSSVATRNSVDVGTPSLARQLADKADAPAPDPIGPVDRALRVYFPTATRRLSAHGSHVVSEVFAQAGVGAQRAFFAEVGSALRRAVGPGQG